MSTPTSMDRGTSVDVVYKNIYDDIRRRYFHPGQKLVVRELSERYELSQTPIRQALNRLIADNIVVNVPRFGAYVRRITWDEIKEALEARLMIEHYAAPFVVSDEENAGLLPRLEECLDGMSRLKESTDHGGAFTRHMQCDGIFHRHIVECIHNPSIIGYYKELNSPIYFNYVYFGKTLQRLRDSCDEHAAIFAAIQSRNLPAVRQAMTVHLENTKADYGRILSEETGDR